MNLVELTPLELNKFRFSGNHTPLTPEQIESLKKNSELQTGSQSPVSTSQSAD